MEKLNLNREESNKIKKLWLSTLLIASLLGCQPDAKNNISDKVKTARIVDNGIWSIWIESATTEEDYTVHVPVDTMKINHQDDTISVDSTTIERDSITIERDSSKYNLESTKDSVNKNTSPILWANINTNPDKASDYIKQSNITQEQLREVIISQEPGSTYFITEIWLEIYHKKFGNLSPTEKEEIKEICKGKTDGENGYTNKSDFDAIRKEYDAIRKEYMKDKYNKLIARN